MKQNILFLIKISILFALLSACSTKQADVISNTVGVTATSKPSLPTATATPVPEATDSITSTPVPEVTKPIIATPVPAKQSLKDKLLAKIIKKDRTLADNDVDVISEDYDGNGAEEYYYVFTKKGLSKEISFDYPVNIWFGNEAGVSQVIETNIYPDTYGSITLAGNNYFRYDLAFVTDSQSQLLSVKDNKFYVIFNAPGYIEIDNNRRDFTVLSSSYDMTRSKSDDILCGHTWKRYYFYTDKKGFHEYGGIKISKKEFLKYPGAFKILKDIRKEYVTDDSKLSYQFIRRSNKLLHINIINETKDDISYSYKTYRIKKDALELSESDLGNYATAIMPDIAVYD